MSKVQCNATEPDDLAALPPVEGGPKTAEVPDDLIMATKLLDEVDLSSRLTDSQWSLLQKVILENQLAFGLDNHLGNNDACVEIHLKPDAQPVSLPPFLASPANQAVMDKQIDSWIQLGVIEPSQSPWAAPAFIVYRNSKPRIVIDYQKLNSMVIPDE
ncbi:hypothetical protein ARMGADRAFT_1075145 [Armillaria gallica]|uniref:DNA/RNA polymerase n=1 Tax=Armillaria gallica TaxID=47427 RepID=A0A2H3DST3_ARMGA|nr:hypothetical protein ARMGADRAFT_1075145 [Armillaria gallica]